MDGAADVGATEETAETEVAETAETAVAATPATAAAAAKAAAKLPDIRAPSIPTFHQESGTDVDYIISGGGGHISVLSRRPAHGRIFSHPSNQNETGTSPAVTKFRALTVI